MTPTQILSSLEWHEVDSRLAPDCRRVLRNERFSLTIALRSHDGARIRAAADEAIRVAQMWMVPL